MAIALKLDTGRFAQMTTSDTLYIDDIDRLSGSGNMTIGASLGAAEELQLGSATSDVRILGDLAVDGSSTISVNETVTGDFSVEGDTTLGNNNGDTVYLGGGTNDSVILQSDMSVGAGTLDIGASTSDYLATLWLAKAGASPVNAAYNLQATGTNAGAYSVGIDASLLTNATRDDLMGALDQLDAAISAGASGSGTTNLTWTVNSDAASGSEEDPALILTGGNGVDSVITSKWVQDSSTKQVYLAIDDDGTQVSPVAELGDPASTVASIVPKLEFNATNTTPTVVTGALSFATSGTNTYGDFVFDGDGLTTDSAIYSTQSGVDLGSTTYRWQNGYFAGTVVAGSADLTNFCYVGSATISDTKLDATGAYELEADGTITLDSVAASADGKVVITNSGATPTGADLEFAIAGSQILRTGDSATAIDVADLVDGSAGVFTTTDVTFTAIGAKMTERASDPTNAANTGFIYVKDDGGDTELYYMDDGGAVVQITKDGALNVSDTGTDNVSWTINEDATGNPQEDPFLQLKGGTGSAVTTGQLFMDSSEFSLSVIMDNGSGEVSPKFEIGNDASTTADLHATLEWNATNSTPAVVTGGLKWDATGTNTYGDFIFTGAGLTASSAVYSDTAGVDLGTSGNPWGTVYAGTSAVIGGAETLTLTGQKIDATNPLEIESATSITFDAIAASGDGKVVISNSGASATGADLEFATAGSQILRTGDSASAIDVADLVDGSAAVFTTTDVTFTAIGAKMTERSGDPTQVLNTGFIYVKDDGGDTELFYKDDSGNVVQITKDGAVNAASTLQAAYEGGNTADITSAEGSFTLQNTTDADTTTILSVVKTVSAASTGGFGIDVTNSALHNGTLVRIVNTGTGNALQVVDGSTPIITAAGTGAVTITPTTGTNFTCTTLGSGAINLTSGSGNITINATSAELTLDDTGSSSTTLSQSGDRTFDQTGTGEVLNGATSLIGAINRLARAIDVTGAVVIEMVAAAAITAGQCVALDTGGATVDRCRPANANAGAYVDFLGIALNTVTAGGTARIVVCGRVDGISGASWSMGSSLYIPDGTGIPTTSAPGGSGDYVYRLGYAIDGDSMILMPGEPVKV